ncbi:MAG: hypothetical protein AAF517_07630 [Planctomycetota bacterium]
MLRSLTCFALAVVILGNSAIARAGEVDCEALDDPVLTDLVLQANVNARPGQRTPIWLGRWECCAFLVPVNACIEWSVEPAQYGTFETVPFEPDSFDPRAFLTVSKDTPPGTVLTVSASIESGKRVLTREVHVYTPESNPLVGTWAETAQEACPGFTRSDVDQSGSSNLTDAVRIFNFLFTGGEAPLCEAAADVNRDLGIDVSDGIYLLNYLFLGGDEPPAPYPDCGPGNFLEREPCTIPACGGERLQPEFAVNELVFNADGTFQVTWFPFEVYVDYWGRYDFDLETGTIELFPTGGNFIPDDLQADGTFVVAAGGFELRHIWLGTPRGLARPVELPCAQVFGR